MRVWDVPPQQLCRSHLLGEHREIHALWAVLTANKKGYVHHPETLRWKGRLMALYLRHEADVAEMARRGYCHATPLDVRLATGAAQQDVYVDPPDEQVRILRRKGCDCHV